MDSPAHKRERALEGSKTDDSVDMIADLSEVKMERQQTPEIRPLVDSSFPEKEDKQALISPEDHTLPGNQATQIRVIDLQPLKQAPVLGGAECSTDNQTQAPERICTEPRGLPEKTSGVIAAVSNGCEPHPSEAERAGIDTVAPFESLKKSGTYLGERMDVKPQHQVLPLERSTTPGFDFQKAYEEVGHCQELLHKEEASIAEVLLELEKVKEQIQVCKGKVPGSLGNSEASPPSSQPEEISNVGAPRDLFVSIARELEMARKEIKNVHEQRIRLENSNQLALKEREAAFSALEAASTRIEELVTKQASSQEELGAAKAALAEVESEIGASRLTASVEPNGKSSRDVEKALHVSPSQLATLKSLDVNFSEASVLIGKLKEELVTIRNVKTTASSSESNSEDKITKVKLRLEQAKTAEGDTVAAIGRILEELDEAKMNLSKVMQDGASLASAVGALQSEVSKSHAELESARETEQIACATLASLQDELCSIRNLVLSAHASEVRAREAKRTNPTEIKRLVMEADQAKTASSLAKEEARKGLLALEQAKAAMITAVSRLQAAQKEAEAARASEAMAVSQFMALSESKGELAVSKEGSEAEKGAVNISLQEYKALLDAGHEAEAAASEKVAAAIAQVEAAKASQKNAQEKLDAALNELEVLQKAMEEAQKKADDAQTAKLSVEADLRKWRGEHDQRRRTSSNPSSVSTSAAQSPRISSKLSSQGRVSSHSFQGKPGAVGLDSLAEVLSLKLPPAEKAIKKLPEDDVAKKPGVVSLRSPPAEKAIQKLPADVVVKKLEDVLLKKPEKVKKGSFFSRVMAIMARKKSKSGRKVINT